MKMNEESKEKVEVGVELTDESLEGVAGGILNTDILLIDVVSVANKENPVDAGYLYFPKYKNKLSIYEKRKK